MEELFRQGQRQRGCQFQTGGGTIILLAPVDVTNIDASASTHGSAD